MALLEELKPGVLASLIEPLPHQITAVYETMLGKQPLRYLLSDDPGAGNRNNGTEKHDMKEVISGLEQLA
jgi:hypothetical protein